MRHKGPARALEDPRGIRHFLKWDYRTITPDRCSLPPAVHFSRNPVFTHYHECRRATMVRVMSRRSFCDY